MNQQAMLRKARQLQKEMMETQKEIEMTEFRAACGPLTITMLGSKEVISVNIDSDFVIDSSEDKELLEDSFVAAMQKLNKEIADFTEEKMSKYKAMFGGFGGF